MKQNLFAKLICSVLLLLPLKGGFAAPLVNYNVDFDSYALGNVLTTPNDSPSVYNGAPNLAGSAWRKSATSTTISATVVTPTNTIVGNRVLEVERVSGSVQFLQDLSTPLELTTGEKSYFSVDFNTLAGGGNFALINGTNVTSLGFGAVVVGGTQLRINTSSTESGTTRLTLPTVLTTDQWYRLEWEITSSSATAGTFDLYISSQSSQSRTLLLDNQVYSFLFDENTTFFTNGGANGAKYQLANINLQSGLESFPVNPIPEASAVAYLALGGCFLVLSWRRKARSSQ